jgi:DNA polymerase III delta prime subunit
MFDSLWVEKYRPSTLDEMCIDESIKKQFVNYLNTQETPNLLFVGRAGIGKTSLAKIIVNNILKCQYLYINASDENGIDTIRTKVTRFAQTKSLDGNIKVIILDEVDGLTMDAQRALRNTMEEYSANCRFILTANYKHKVIEPLHSRSQYYDLTPPYEQYIDRLKHVLDSEKVEYNDEHLVNIRSKVYPDLRLAINEIQKLTDGNKLTEANIDNVNKFVETVYQLIQNNVNITKLRETIISKEQSFNADYQHLLKQLFEVICESKSPDMVKKQHLIVVSEHMYRSSLVVDQEINFFSCLLNISSVT